MADIIEQAKVALEGTTRGPWGWQVNRDDKRVELCGGSRASDLVVMSFARYGLNSAAPVFWCWRGNVSDEPKRADKLAVPVPGREHHADWWAKIDHPDARFIAEARQLVPELIAEVERLRAALADKEAA